MSVQAETPNQSSQAGLLSLLQLENFRRFDSTGPIHLAPITLLFGKNSSGKTSLLRSPLLLKQFVDARSDDVTLSGSEVDFGSYRETVHNGQLRRDIKLEAKFHDLPRPSHLRMPRRANSRLHPLYQVMLDNLSLQVTLHWNVRNSKIQIDRIRFAGGPNDQAEIALQRRGPNGFTVDFPAQNYRANIPLPLVFPSLRFLDLYTPSPDEASTSEEGQRVRDLTALDYLLFQCVNRINDVGSRLIHIGPLRQMPDRAYRTDQPGVGGSGASVVDLLDGESAVQKRVSDALSYMGMAREVQLKTLAPGYMGIVLIDSSTGRADNLADVGFGVSQVLPLLASLATAPRGSTVLIEQPELHLHPDAQGALADVLVAIADERSLGLVIESHSEHILLRLQRRVAENRLFADRLAAYFVDDGKVTRAGINELGRLDARAMPAGFFEEEWADAVELARASAKRSLAE